MLIIVQPDYDRIIKNIERGEARISRKDEIMKAIGKKLDRYKNPWLELKIQYGQNKGKFYNEECDRFMVCSLTILCGFLYLSTWNMATKMVLCFSFAWCTNLDMETGMNWKLPSVCLPCSDLIGLWSPELPKSWLGGVIPLSDWLRKKIKNMMSKRGRQGRRKGLLRQILNLFTTYHHSAAQHSVVKDLASVVGFANTDVNCWYYLIWPQTWYQQNMTPTKRAALRNSEGENAPLSSFKRRRQSLMDDYVGSVRDNSTEFIHACNLCASRGSSVVNMFQGRRKRGWMWCFWSLQGDAVSAML